MMQIYSKTSQSFLLRVKGYLKEIMANEMGLFLKNKRFLYRKYTYPINLVVFESTKALGNFDPLTYHLGLNKVLMYKTDTSSIKDILRHELAHLITHIEHGDLIKPHGAEFKEICERYGWPSEIQMASINLDDKKLYNDKVDLQSEKIISKVEKLLKLATSSNQHEAELATIKANQLLLKHNLEMSSRSDDDREFFLKKIICAKKVNAKHRAISNILGTFFVYPVFCHGKGGFYLEVTGTRANIELADYIANFLDHHLDELWNEAKKKINYQNGLQAKNSFMRGIATGYVEKIEQSKREISSSKELIVIEHELKKGIQMAYGRLRSSSSTSKNCKESNSLGHKMGQNLNINPAIKSDSTKKLLQ